MVNDLEVRVHQFKMMELPGQLMGVHMGTYHLIHAYPVNAHRS